MHFVAYTSTFLLGMFVSTTIAAHCDSGLTHDLGTHCDNQGAYACSSLSRAYILYCDTTSTWVIEGGVNCPSGTGCHNCACAQGY
ncbi:hypothetical protein F4825DRAFT_407826 [Nemania diffusa]|nr:hypothetical protein F4825DRAFT_407826 [Nemania diffusa]